MADYHNPTKPALQKPPGYKDPAARPPPKPIPFPPSARKQRLPPSFRPRKKRRNCCRICCCCFCILLIIIILLAAILGAIFFLWFDPKLPTFHLQSFTISPFNVSVKPEGTVINSVTTAMLEVRNPNEKLMYRYGDSKVVVTAGEEETNFGEVNVAGFDQGGKNTTSLKVVTRVKDMMVDDVLGKRLQAQFKSKELVVNVDVKTKVGVEVGGSKIGMLGVRVLCENIKLKLLDAGEMPKCTVNMLKWINIH